MQLLVVSATPLPDAGVLGAIRSAFTSVEGGVAWLTTRRDCDADSDGAAATTVVALPRASRRLWLEDAAAHLLWPSLHALPLSVLRADEGGCSSPPCSACGSGVCDVGGTDGMHVALAAMRTCTESVADAVALLIEESAHTDVVAIGAWGGGCVKVARGALGSQREVDE